MRGFARAGFTVLLLITLLAGSVAAAPPAAAPARPGEPPSAPAARTVHLRCPVCGVDVVGTVPDEGTTVGLMGDLCPRTVGVPPYEVGVFTCTACWYSGFADDFDPAAPMPRRVGVSPDAAARILTGTGLASPTRVTSGTPSDAIPVSVRLALAAATDELVGGPSLRSAQRHVLASWSVRGSFVIESVLDADRLGAFRAWLEGAAPAPTAERGAEWYADGIRVGEHFLAMARSARGPDRGFAYLMALTAFRREGEHAAVEHVLPRLRPFLGPDEYRSLARALSDSMGQERALQEAAARILDALPGPDPAASPEAAHDAASRAYLRAELARRLGELETARRQFALALAPGGLDADLQAQVAGQAARTRRFPYDGSPRPPADWEPLP